MRILAVSDEESRFIWDYFDPERFRGVEAVVSCGDLKREYLEFLATMLPVPVLYVPGNHDAALDAEPPGGCMSIDRRIQKIGGLRFLGLGGCKGHGKKPYVFTEEMMRRRVSKLWLPLKKHDGFDVLVTHAPALGLGDGKDSFHQGFAVFRELISRYSPRLHLFGHQHSCYSPATPGQLEFQGTKIINACGYRILDI